MGTVVTKSFKIKTGENSFSEPINFLSESVFFRDGENLDFHLKSLNDKIDKEIQDEQTARQNEDSALGNRINTLTKNLNTEISEREKSISTLQATVEENTKNISSLESFIKGENQIEENTPCLVDQVRANATKAQENYDAIEALKTPVNANTTKTKDNYDAIEALKTLVGASSLEEGAPNILDIINSLESRIFVLEGLVLTAPDEPGEEDPVEPETPEGGETEEPIE